MELQLDDRLARLEQRVRDLKCEINIDGLLATRPIRARDNMTPLFDKSPQTQGKSRQLWIPLQISSRALRLGRCPSAGRVEPETLDREVIVSHWPGMTSCQYSPRVEHQDY
ncbi:hypothetical protein Bbelb_207420 [Branchiostoma belcheri]|nr:hypothetical protein Bbelb_207420 [Branchiostoma belcheri]